MFLADGIIVGYRPPPPGDAMDADREGPGGAPKRFDISGVAPIDVGNGPLLTAVCKAGIV